MANIYGMRILFGLFIYKYIKTPSQVFLCTYKFIKSGVKFAWLCLQCDSKGKGGGALKRNIGGSSFKKIDSYFTKKPRLENAHLKKLSTITTEDNNYTADASASTATLPVLTIDEEKICPPVTNDIKPIVGMYVDF